MTNEKPNEPGPASENNLPALLGNLVGIGIALLIDLLSKSRR